MDIIANTMNWLNAEESSNEVTLQRDGVYALLSWRDFNQPVQADCFSFRTAAWLFILAVGVPVLMML